MKNLADKLDDIAVGNTFDGQTLYDARRHPAVTSNDRLVLLRFDYGNMYCLDHIRLQEIAIYIREWEKENANK